MSAGVALKVLNADPNSQAGEIRFIREIRMLARLQHPNILPLHDSGHVEAMLYYVMPYVSGESLRLRMSRERQLPIEVAAPSAAKSLTHSRTRTARGSFTETSSPRTFSCRAVTPSSLISE